MKKIHKLALAGVTALTMSIAPAMADDHNMMWVPNHHLVDEKSYEKYADSLPNGEKIELREYIEYEQREPCQFYQPIPQGFVRDGCDLKREGMVAEKKVETKRTVMRVGNVITDYEINFAFDSSALSPQAKATLDRVANEIKRYNPREVTVAGHTDTSGPSDYNVRLSERRAQSVSDALTARGITNRILDKDAYGERKLAVETRDGVPLRENRRVVIEFRK